MFNVLSVLVVGEVSVHLHLHEEDSEGGGAQLDDPGNNPEECGDDEDAVQEPQQGKRLKRNYNHKCNLSQCNSMLLPISL